MDYEGYREVNSGVSFVTLPNAAQRGGNLSVPVRNPITGTLYANGVVPQSV